MIQGFSTDRNVDGQFVRGHFAAVNCLGLFSTGISVLYDITFFKWALLQFVVLIVDKLQRQVIQKFLHQYRFKFLVPE